MSSTQSSFGVEGHVSPAEAFDRCVWHNPRVCNACFEHVKQIDRGEPRSGLSVEDHYRTENATLEPDTDPVDTHGAVEASRARTTCSTCARVGCWADEETLSKIEAVRLTTPLAERLRDAGVAFDEQALRRAVRLFKEIDDVQGYDTEIFRRSTKLAVLRG